MIYKAHCVFSIKSHLINTLCTALWHVASVKSVPKRHLSSISATFFLLRLTRKEVLSRHSLASSFVASFHSVCHPEPFQRRTLHFGLEEIDGMTPLISMNGRADRISMILEQIWAVGCSRRGGCPAVRRPDVKVLPWVWPSPGRSGKRPQCQAHICSPNRLALKTNGHWISHEP